MERNTHVSGSQGGNLVETQRVVGLLRNNIVVVAGKEAIGLVVLRIQPGMKTHFVETAQMAERLCFV